MAPPATSRAVDAMPTNTKKKDSKKQQRKEVRGRRIRAHCSNRSSTCAVLQSHFPPKTLHHLSPSLSHHIKHKPPPGRSRDRAPGDRAEAASRGRRGGGGPPRQLYSLCDLCAQRPRRHHQGVHLRHPPRHPVRLGARAVPHQHAEDVRGRVGVERQAEEAAAGARESSLVVEIGWQGVGLGCRSVERTYRLPASTRLAFLAVSSHHLAPPAIKKRVNCRRRRASSWPLTSRSQQQTAAAAAAARRAARSLTSTTGWLRPGPRAVWLQSLRLQAADSLLSCSPPVCPYHPHTAQPTQPNLNLNHPQPCPNHHQPNLTHPHPTPRFEIEDGLAVAYCYEVQLEGPALRKGLGKHLMQLLELMVGRADDQGDGGERR